MMSRRALLATAAVFPTAARADLLLEGVSRARGAGGTPEGPDTPHAIPNPYSGLISVNPAVPDGGTTATLAWTGTVSTGQLFAIFAQWSGWSQAVFNANAAGITVTDSAGNAYTIVATNFIQDPLGTNPASTNSNLLAYCRNPLGLVNGSTTVITFPTNFGHCSADLTAYVGVGDWLLDTYSYRAQVGGGTVFNAAPITTSTEGCLVVSGCAAHGATGDVSPSGVPTPGVGLTGRHTGSTGNIADGMLTTRGGITYQWSSGATDVLAIYVMAFRPNGSVPNNNDGNSDIGSGTLVNTVSVPTMISRHSSVFIVTGYNDTTARTLTITDNGSAGVNTYTILARLSDPNNHSAFFAYCNDVKGNPTQFTMTYAGAGAPANIVTSVQEFAGRWALDGTISTTNTGTGNTLVAKTTTVANSFGYVTTWYNAGGGGPVPTNQWNARNNKAGVTVAIDKEQVSPGTISPAPSYVGNNNDLMTWNMVWKPV